MLRFLNDPETGEIVGDVRENHGQARSYNSGASIRGHGPLLQVLNDPESGVIVGGVSRQFLSGR